MPDVKYPVMPQEDNPGGAGTGRIPVTKMVADSIGTIDVGFSASHKIEAAGIDDDLFAGIAIAIGALA